MKRNPQDYNSCGSSRSMGSSRVDVDYYEGDMEESSVREKKKMKETRSLAKKKRRSGKY